ncbi:MAG: hypothetical protein IKT01_06590 [Eubacteriaceae bacterium]|nr:hypothetical protein [Eubacteriaceae bacterium]
MKGKKWLSMILSLVMIILLCPNAAAGSDPGRQSEEQQRSVILAERKTTRPDGVSVENSRSSTADYATEEVTQITEDPLNILVQPSDRSVAYGETGQFTVSAIGPGPLSYQWYFRKSTSLFWYPSIMEDAQTDTHCIEMAESRDGQAYCCVVTDKYGNSVTSDVVMFKAVAPFPELRIVEQPTYGVAPIGELTSFRVAAEGNGLSYQWQYCKPGKTKWYNSTMFGATSDEVLVPLSETRNGQKYRCIVSDISGKKVISGAAAAYVESHARILNQPKSNEADVGEIVLLSIIAQGEGLSYQWQYMKANGTKWYNSGMDGATWDTLVVPLIEGRNGQKYRCIVTDSYGICDISDIAVLKLRNNINVTKQPSDVNADRNTTVTFTVEAEGDSLSYQWEYQLPGKTTWHESTASGFDTPELAVFATTQCHRRKYRCKISESSGAYVYTDAAVIWLAPDEKPNVD